MMRLGAIVRKRPKSALMLLIGVLLSSLLVVDIFIFLHQRGMLYVESVNNTEAEAELLADLVKEGLLRSDYALVEDYLLSWSEKNPMICKSQISSPKGYLLTGYVAEKSQNERQIEIHKEIKAEGRTLAFLTLVKDINSIDKELLRLVYILAFSSLLISVMVAMPLWLFVRGHEALIESEKRLEEIAHYDALTNLPNRRLLADRMRQSMAITDRLGSLLAICFLDLDGFKPVNDSHGHGIGDKLLIAVSERLKAAVRGGDTVSRLGGDEFVLVLNGQQTPDDCRDSLVRLLEDLSKPYLINDLTIQVTGSIGVTLYPDDHSDPDTLLRHADYAMYRAKEMGRNRFCIFDPMSSSEFNMG